MIRGSVLTLWKCFVPILTAENGILQIQRKNEVMFVYHVLQSLRMLASRPCVPESPRPTTQSPSPRPTFSDSLFKALSIMKVFSLTIHDSTQPNRKTIITTEALSFLSVEKIIHHFHLGRVLLGLFKQ